MKVYYFDYPRIIRRCAWIIAILLAVVLLFKLVQYSVFSSTVTNSEPIYQGDNGKKEIALTCNVMWGEEFLPDMLKILKETDVKVTFNVGGQWAEKFPELTKKLADQGHEIGNHGYSHPHPTYISKQQNVEEIKKTEEIIYKASGQKTKLFAPPYGEYNKTVLTAADSIGYKTILWSIDTIDWQRPAPEVIIERVMRKAHNGAIVLMHPTAPTIKALPELLKRLSNEGYDLVTVSKLIGVDK